MNPLSVQAEREGGWRGIESAPRDDTRFLIGWAESRAIEIGTFIRGQLVMDFDFEGFAEGKGPTHWHPLPVFFGAASIRVGGKVSTAGTLHWSGLSAESLERLPPLSTRSVSDPDVGGDEWEYQERAHRHYLRMARDSYDAGREEFTPGYDHYGDLLAAAEYFAALPAAPSPTDVDARAGEVERALTHATELARALFNQHYRSDECYASGRVQWEPLSDLCGALSQIDNMMAGLTRPTPAGDADLIGELVEALERATGLIEYAEKVTNWESTAWLEPSAAEGFRALLARALATPEQMEAKS